MTRGGSRKRHQSLRKGTDENDHSQTGQGEEIATPPAPRTHPRRCQEVADGTQHSDKILNN